MNLLGTDEKTAKLLCSIKVELGGGPGGLAMRAESASLWHQRMGHINRKSIEVLRRMPGSAIDYNGDVQACDVCAVGKNNQQAHPKQATYDVQHAFQLVTVDLMGAMTPAALGGYSHVTKFVDQHTKLREIFLIMTKPQALDALVRYNKTLVIPNNKRLIRLRADKGTEFTSSEFTRYCHDIGVSLEIASPNTPQQIAMSGQEGRLLELCVACLLIRVYHTFSGES